MGYSCWILPPHSTSCYRRHPSCHCSHHPTPTSPPKCKITQLQIFFPFLQQVYSTCHSLYIEYCTPAYSDSTLHRPYPVSTQPILQFHTLLLIRRTYHNYQSPYPTPSSALSYAYPTASPILPYAYPNPFLRPILRLSYSYPYPILRPPYPFL